ncbi:replication initiation negative regulator SeqA [Kluyvera cryocrescens]|uniref:replication initiation negative regulator SeqA n=1 Tax=Kluyvera cryocrescens TaxID=580 RepID=UPI002DBDB757|nr:replication initiation negative regulator SeqA [Kluyvera cryocrescens]MEB7711494.1 replication initiation negative regulator SeqA [Kluyvera cryocrescens]
MKTIEVDDELYRYIAAHTLHIGESASDILRRMLKFTAATQPAVTAAPVVKAEAAPAPTAAPVAEVKTVKTAKDKVRAMRELLLSDEYAEQRKAVNRFMLILTTLYSLDNKAFAEATESLHGRTRVYFAADEQTLLKNGNQTKPKQVPDTPYWVITNTNTGRKCSMVEHIMQSMQFPVELIEKVCGTISY